MFLLLIYQAKFSSDIYIWSHKMTIILIWYFLHEHDTIYFNITYDICNLYFKQYHKLLLGSFSPFHSAVRTILE